MGWSATCRWAVVAGVAVSGATAMAQQGRVDPGLREYQANCAACHGVSGKGDGPYNELLKRSATDLSTLSRRNGGVFPVARLYEVIEGAGTGHGSREMPIFGQSYRVRAGEYYADMPYDPEPFVRGRILSLIEYLNRLQVK